MKREFELKCDKLLVILLTSARVSMGQCIRFISDRFMVMFLFLFNRKLNSNNYKLTVNIVFESQVN